MRIRRIRRPRPYSYVNGHGSSATARANAIATHAGRRRGARGRDDGDASDAVPRDLPARDDPSKLRLARTLSDCARASVRAPVGVDDRDDDDAVQRRKILFLGVAHALGTMVVWAHFFLYQVSRKRLARCRADRYSVSETPRRRLSSEPGTRFCFKWRCCC